MPDLAPAGTHYGLVDRTLGAIQSNYILSPIVIVILLLPYLSAHCHNGV